MSYNKKDHYYALAKRDGFRARSAYKLQQIQKKFNILRRGNNVIDFGAAPGAWTQIASKIVGNKGKIIAVDKNPIRSFTMANVVILLMDIRSPKLIEYVEDELSGKVDVILSDLAGNTSGNWHLDVERQVHLATIAFESASKLLLPGGNFVTKVFRGPPLKELEALLKDNFTRIKHWRPPATRKSSAEEYLICMNYRPVDVDIE